MGQTRGELGERIAGYGRNRGIGGWENRAFWMSRWLWVPLTAFMFAPFGLIVSVLFESDVVILIAVVIGAVAGYFIPGWFRRQTAAAVTGAELFSGGMVLTDSRGEHVVRWNEVVEVLGQRTEHRLEGVNVRVSYRFVVRTADQGFLLDERLEKVDELASRIAAEARVQITPLA